MAQQTAFSVMALPGPVHSFVAKFPGRPGPYYVPAGQVYQTGAASGEVFMPGEAAGEVYHAGTVKGEVK